jgi:hypothetical protein
MRLIGEMHVRLDLCKCAMRNSVTARIFSPEIPKATSIVAANNALHVVYRRITLRKDDIDT